MTDDAEPSPGEIAETRSLQDDLQAYVDADDEVRPPSAVNGANEDHAEDDGHATTIGLGRRERVLAETSHDGDHVSAETSGQTAERSDDGAAVGLGHDDRVETVAVSEADDPNHHDGGTHVGLSHDDRIDRVVDENELYVSADTSGRTANHAREADAPTTNNSAHHDDRVDNEIHGSAEIPAQIANHDRDHHDNVDVVSADTSGQTASRTGEADPTTDGAHHDDGTHVGHGHDDRVATVDNAIDVSAETSGQTANHAREADAPTTNNGHHDDGSHVHDDQNDRVVDDNEIYASAETSGQTANDDHDDAIDVSADTSGQTASRTHEADPTTNGTHHDGGTHAGHGHDDRVATVDNAIDVSAETPGQTAGGDHHHGAAVDDHPIADDDEIELHASLNDPRVIGYAAGSVDLDSLEAISDEPSDVDALAEAAVDELGSTDTSGGGPNVDPVASAPDSDERSRGS